MQLESWPCLWSVRLDRRGTVELTQATGLLLPPQAQQRTRFCVQSEGTGYHSYGRTREVRSRRRIRKWPRRGNRRELGHCMKVTARGCFTALRADRFPQLSVLVCGCRCEVLIWADLCDSIRSHCNPCVMELAEAVRFELTEGLPPRQFSRLLP